VIDDFHEIKSILTSPVATPTFFPRQLAELRSSVYTKAYLSSLLHHFAAHQDKSIVARLDSLHDLFQDAVNLTKKNVMFPSLFSLIIPRSACTTSSRLFLTTHHHSIRTCGTTRPLAPPHHSNNQTPSDCIHGFSIEPYLSDSKNVIRLLCCVPPDHPAKPVLRSQPIHIKCSSQHSMWSIIKHIRAALSLEQQRICEDGSDSLPHTVRILSNPFHWERDREEKGNTPLTHTRPARQSLSRKDPMLLNVRVKAIAPTQFQHSDVVPSFLHVLSSRDGSVPPQILLSPSAPPAERSVTELSIPLHCISSVDVNTDMQPHGECIIRVQIDINDLQSLRLQVFDLLPITYVVVKARGMIAMKSLNFQGAGKVPPVLHHHTDSVDGGLSLPPPLPPPSSNTLCLEA
jgi:hypothetical protein